MGCWWLELGRVPSGYTKTTTARPFNSVSPSPHSSYASLRKCGMALCLLKTWLSYFGASVPFRLLGLPAALTTLHLQLYGALPATASLILHRLSRRLSRHLLKSLVCSLRTQEHDMTSPTDLAAAKLMDATTAPQQTLQGKGAGPNESCSTASPVASPHLPSQPSPKLPMPQHSRSKTTSHVDVVRTGKRLSLQFPIQPASGTSSRHSPRSRPQSWIAPSPVLSPNSETAPSESNILADLAAQERYVLELKEELNKAEAELTNLKKHYALHEANKRHSTVRKVTQLQPLNTSLIDVIAGQDEVEGSPSWLQGEMERRKALLNKTKDTKRKVFAPSRHMRTLSLLSPDKMYSPSFPQPLDVQEEEPASKHPDPPTRASTSSDVTRNVADTPINERFDMGGMPNIQRDQLVRAGTQMASDIKKGLFSFIEDIRQATVGDEAIDGPQDISAFVNARDPLIKNGRKASNGRPSLNRSSSSKKSAHGNISTGDDFWKEMGLSEPKASPTHNKKTHINKHAQTPQKQVRNYMDEEEEWDNWETPNENFIVKPTTQDSSEESDGDTSSSRTRGDSKASSLTTNSSIGNIDEVTSKRNSIPWPDLVKLSPNNLKRTASHLMKEWEKQLTPPPESRQNSHSHGDYVGRSESHADLI
jgi:hypothetical protein